MNPYVPTEADFYLTYSLSLPYKCKDRNERTRSFSNSILICNFSFHTLPVPNPGPYQPPFPGTRYRKRPQNAPIFLFTEKPL